VNLEALTAAQDALRQLDNEAEPILGPFKLSRWEPGAFSENVVVENYFQNGVQVKEYENGAYQEIQEGGVAPYEMVVLGEATGPTVLEYTAGPYFQSALYTLYSQDAGILALRNGDIDFLLTPNGIQQGFVNQLREDPDIQIVNNPSNGFRYLAFNYAREGLGDPVLHQAIACVMDLDFLANRVLQGQVLPVYTLVPEGNGYWHNPETPRYCQGMDDKGRIEQATAWLKDAGYSWDVEPSWNEDRGGSVNYGEGLTLPGGTKMPEYTLLAPSAGYDPLRATTGVYVEQWMRSLGMPVTTELTNFNNILTAVYDTGEYDMFILGWGLTSYPDYLCDFFDQNEGNPQNYVSEELKAQCEVFKAEKDIEVARDQAFELQNLLATELPYITLFTTPVVDAYRNIEFPYTETLDGIGPGNYGMPALAMPQ
jgi:ABC-type transport system substrate-binding protein